MGKMPDALRLTIARNISYCRRMKFPGRGGSKRCAIAFGVSPQQWSPWESGRRTPDELRLVKLGEFFGVTVEWLRTDHSGPDFLAPDGSPAGRGPAGPWSRDDYTPFLMAVLAEVHTARDILARLDSLCRSELQRSGFPMPPHGAVSPETMPEAFEEIPQCVE